jgi:hypothetical protein
MTLRHSQLVRRGMRPYEDSSHGSGVSAFETGDDFIVVRFKSGEMYVYDHLSTGRAAVEKMKRLAVSGRGLSTYISREVRENYAKKLT